MAPTLLLAPLLLVVFHWRGLETRTVQILVYCGIVVAWTKVDHLGWLKSRSVRFAYLGRAGERVCPLDGFLE
ncbi:uncharacterized protein BDR25DRAFT_132589 [Lindgomyces ingoldianus]|uniref:Uncharacterized protein n=1 Tax=Lindgomyces ingoldianus TaxID=673940 RepID=A0ACB6R2U1_9PLEO|nr:uncharacterized protein BDR25DRAFT_132589 [Lindgomyces ingoldianus]KAF2473491.1 hypothetical protein BDR25DRAFT_132589 [Lindgomyces ingoldianus]